MKTPILIVTWVMLMTPVLAQSVAERTGLNSLTGSSPSTADFVKEAAISDMFETTSSELAAIRTNASTREFAARMNETHQKSSSELVMLVKPHAAQTPMPADMDSAHKAKVMKLKGLEGQAFTRQYQDDQIAAHKAAVSLFQRYASGGDDLKLKAWAKNMLPELQDHLRMAQGLTF